MLWMMAQKNFHSFFLYVLLQPIQIIASGQSTDAQLLTFNSHLHIGIIQNVILRSTKNLSFSAVKYHSWFPTDMNTGAILLISRRNAKPRSSSSSASILLCSTRRSSTRIRLTIEPFIFGRSCHYSIDRKLHSHFPSSWRSNVSPKRRIASGSSFWSSISRSSYGILYISVTSAILSPSPMFSS